MRQVSTVIRGSGRRNPLLTVVLVLVAIWVVLSIIGLVIKGLFHLFVFGVIAFVATLAYGAFTAGRRSGRR